MEIRRSEYLWEMPYKEVLISDFSPAFIARNLQRSLLVQQSKALKKLTSQ